MGWFHNLQPIVKIANVKLTDLLILLLLTEKVKLLESEWKEAIGNQFEEVRERLERQVRGEPVAEA